MLENKKVLAFIGARSGSKGLSDKNIKSFHGKPLMAWTILAALASKYIDKVVVSTDAIHYAEIAKRFGADVILRPKKLSDDDASLMDALKYTVDQLADVHYFDVVVNLQPTSPLRTTLHIDQALELYKEQQSYMKNVRVFSCYQVLNKFAWLMRSNEQGCAHFIDQQEKNKNHHARQANAEVILPNGAIFILPIDDLTTFYNNHTVPYIMSEASSIDIDSQADFDLAVELFEKFNS